MPPLLRCCHWDRSVQYLSPSVCSVLAFIVAVLVVLCPAVAEASSCKLQLPSPVSDRAVESVIWAGTSRAHPSSLAVLILGIAGEVPSGGASTVLIAYANFTKREYSGDLVLIETAPVCKTNVPVIDLFSPYHRVALGLGEVSGIASDDMLWVQGGTGAGQQLLHFRADNFDKAMNRLGEPVAWNSIVGCVTSTVNVEVSEGSAVGIDLPAALESATALDMSTNVDTTQLFIMTPNSIVRAPFDRTRRILSSGDALQGASGSNINRAIAVSEGKITVLSASSAGALTVSAMPAVTSSLAAESTIPGITLVNSTADAVAIMSAGGNRSVTSLPSSTEWVVVAPPRPDCVSVIGLRVAGQDVVSEASKEFCSAFMLTTAFTSAGMVVSVGATAPNGVVLWGSSCSGQIFESTPPKEDDGEGISLVVGISVIIILVLIAFGLAAFVLHRRRTLRLKQQSRRSSGGEDHRPGEEASSRSQSFPSFPAVGVSDSPGSLSAQGEAPPSTSKLPARPPRAPRDSAQTTPVHYYEFTPPSPSRSRSMQSDPMRSNEFEMLPPPEHLAQSGTNPQSLKASPLRGNNHVRAVPASEQSNRSLGGGSHRSSGRNSSEGRSFEEMSLDGNGIILPPTAGRGANVIASPGAPAAPYMVSLDNIIVSASTVGGDSLRLNSLANTVGGGGPLSINTDSREGTPSSRWETKRKEGTLPAFDLVSTLSNADNSSVYGAELQTGDLVAIKMVNFGAAHKDAAERLVANITALMELNNANLLRYLGVEMNSNLRVSVVMEQAGGGALSKLLKERGGLDSIGAARCMKNVVSGMQCLHTANIIHTRLRCDNLLLTGGSAEGNSDVIKIINAGTEACAANTDTMHDPLWTAPEVTKGSAHTTHSDVWSIGCVALEMLTGKKPFMWGKNANVFAILKKICDDEELELPEALDSAACAFVRECLQHDPAKRPTADELAAHPWLNSTE